MDPVTFMDLIKDHIDYLESEGFKVFDAFDPSIDDDPRTRKTNHKYPHKIIKW